MVLRNFPLIQSNCAPPSGSTAQTKSATQCTLREPKPSSGSAKAASEFGVLVATGKRPLCSFEFGRKFISAANFLGSRADQAGVQVAECLRAYTVTVAPVWKRAARVVRGTLRRPRGATRRRDASFCQ